MPLATVPPDVLNEIALHLALSTPLGPPSNLIPLVSCCKYIAHYLKFDHNSHLYATIFRNVFDTKALGRRLSAHQLTAQNFALELKRRWTSLKRIRRFADPQSNWESRVYKDKDLKEDISTAFLMLIESDGLNAVQLLQYADLQGWVDQYIYKILNVTHVEPEMPEESHETGLVLWMQWMLTDIRQLLHRHFSQVQWLMTPYMLGTFCYKNGYAPWIYPSLPTSPLTSPPPPLPLDPITQNVSPYFIADNQLRENPRFKTSFDYFGEPIQFLSPLVSHTATLLYVANLRHIPATAPGMPPRTPQQIMDDVNYREFVELQYSGGASTIRGQIRPEDVHILEGRRSMTPPYLQMLLPSLVRSASYDDDWSRLISCWNPFTPTPGAAELGMPRYSWRKGSLAGEWDGTFVLPIGETYYNIMSGANAINTIEDTMILQQCESYHLQEYYHLPPSQAAAYPHGRPVGHCRHAGSPVNAFLPAGSTIAHTNDWVYGRGLEVRDQRAPGDPVAFYSEWQDGPRGNDVDVEPGAPEDEFEDQDDGYLRIIVTGHFIRNPFHADIAPTMLGPDTTLIGTVRTWDGQITLQAHIPYTNETDFRRGDWIWRGYLVGEGNFVGRWRDNATDIRRSAHEGVFVLRRRVPTQ